MKRIFKNKGIFTLPFLWGYTVLIGVFSFLPLYIPEKTSVFSSDKIAHFSIYLIMSFLAFNSFSRKGFRQARLKAFVYSFFIGSGIEVIQYFLPWRSFEPQDLMANALGNILGVLFKIV